MLFRRHPKHLLRLTNNAHVEAEAVAECIPTKLRAKKSFLGDISS